MKTKWLIPGGAVVLLATVAIRIAWRHAQTREEIAAVARQCADVRAQIARMENGKAAQSSPNGVAATEDSPTAVDLRSK